MTMTSHERVLCALNHKEADKVPLDLGAGCSCKFTKYFYYKLLDYFGLEEERDHLELNHIPYQLVSASDKVMDLLKTDVRSARLRPIPQKSHYAKKWETEDSYYFTNDWGTDWRMPKNLALYYDLHNCALANAQSIEDDDTYIWPSPYKYKPESRKELEDYLEKGFATTISEQFGNGFFQQGPYIWGFEHWFMMLASEPERCTRFMDKLLDKKKEYYDNIFDVYDGLVDVCCEADDFGTQLGLMISPEMIRDTILPYHQKLIDHIKAKGDIKMTLHSCGSVSRSIPDFIDAGFDALNPVQISAIGMEPAYLKKTFGNDIAFWGGGINTQKTLPQGTPTEVREETKRILDIFAPNGGFIFSPVHNIQDDVPIENFIAMWETFQDNCKY